MQSIIAFVDRLLRARPEETVGAVGPPDGRSELRALLSSVMLLGAVYGLAMGLFGLLGRGGDADGWRQFVATTVKVPLLFLATLAVTFPSLYVVSALAGSELTARTTSTMLLASNTIAVALLASLAPVTAFFTLSTESYAFIALLNFAFFAGASLVGVKYLRRALDAAFPGAVRVRPQEATSAALDAPGDELEARAAAGPPARHRAPAPKPHARRVFELWTLVYVLVGAQMAWVLRPFIGDPYQPFSLFRERERNVLSALWTALLRLFGN
ncbi:MAG: hypothetical protein R3F49_09065 [Planctomycetota bacterium]